MAVIAPLGLEGLKAKVAELYKFRDHFFEQNNLSEARGKAGQVAERKSALLEVFRVEESKVAAEERATFLYLKGRVQNISGEYSPDAEATLSKAVKLNPDLVDAWNELGECYMMKQDWETAKTCFEGALQHRKDKVSLRNLSMTLRQVGASNQDERIGNVELGLARGKEAVGLDTSDGTSWSLLGNAYLSHFFQVSQNPKTLKQAMSSYTQAEKDVVSRSSPELHYNKGIALKYEEEFKLALESFAQASALDPTWQEPRGQEAVLLKYLQDIVTLLELRGKLKAKKLAQLMDSVATSQLGPYANGSYLHHSGTKVKLEAKLFSRLQPGLNSETVVVGRVICSVHTENTVPFTFCLVDAEGTSLAVTVYNLSPGKGVIIGDSVAISEPFFSKVDVVYKEHQFKFPLIRVESPLVLVVNGKKGGKEMLAGVAMSSFTCPT